mgnify:CR=1 FL=1
MDYRELDKIKITNLEVFAYHGVFGFEKKKGQTFFISACIYLDTQQAGLSDELDKTVSYADICDEIVAFNENNTFDLIETVAEKLADTLLDKHSMIYAIDIEISKPYAPVSEKVENLAVCINRCRHKAYIAYGSNMGDSEAIIKKAIGRINDTDCCRVLKESNMLISKAYGEVEQADFYNGVIEVETYLRPYMLLSVLNEIEADAGRTREIHWGPRTLDLDILLYDDIVMDDEKLTIPHADMVNRDFVMKPLCELAPYKLHPVLRKSMKEIADAITDIYIK